MSLERIAYICPKCGHKQHFTFFTEMMGEKQSFKVARKCRNCGKKIEISFDPDDGFSNHLRLRSYHR
jgi:transcription elongation factor Elf1